MRKNKKQPEFPDTIFVTKENLDGDDTYLSAQESIVDAIETSQQVEPGYYVARYEFVEVDEFELSKTAIRTSNLV